MLIIYFQIRRSQYFTESETESGTDEHPAAARLLVYGTELPKGRVRESITDPLVQFAQPSIVITEAVKFDSFKVPDVIPTFFVQPPLDPAAVQSVASGTQIINKVEETTRRSVINEGNKKTSVVNRVKVAQVGEDKRCSIIKLGVAETEHSVAETENFAFVVPKVQQTMNTAISITCTPSSPLEQDTDPLVGFKVKKHRRRRPGASPKVPAIERKLRKNSLQVSDEPKPKVQVARIVKEDTTTPEASRKESVQTSSYQFLPPEIKADLDRLSESTSNKKYSEQSLGNKSLKNIKSTQEKLLKSENTPNLTEEVQKEILPIPAQPANLIQEDPLKKILRKTRLSAKPQLSTTTSASQPPVRSCRISLEAKHALNPEFTPTITTAFKPKKARKDSKIKKVDMACSPIGTECGLIEFDLLKMKLEAFDRTNIQIQHTNNSAVEPKYMVKPRTSPPKGISIAPASPQVNKVPPDKRKSVIVTSMENVVTGTSTSKTKG